MKDLGGAVVTTVVVGGVVVYLAKYGVEALMWKVDEWLAGRRLSRMQRHLAGEGAWVQGEPYFREEDLEAVADDPEPPAGVIAETIHEFAALCGEMQPTARDIHELRYYHAEDWEAVV